MVKLTTPSIETKFSVDIYTDGSIDKNPGGTGGHAAVLLYRKPEDHSIFVVKEVMGFDFKTTNNRQEMKAAVLGLRYLKHPCSATIYSDSQYLVKGMTKWVRAWGLRSLKDKANGDLWLELHELRSIHETSWQWVRGHADDYWNNRADHLARVARKNAGRLPWVENKYETTSEVIESFARRGQYEERPLPISP